MAKGKVYIVGAGPGDPELITVKGLNRLKTADVVLYDFLASKKLLKFAKPKAEIICVGKKDGMHLLKQDKINNLLYQKANKGKSVVRLKGGDPFIFSRGIDEALYLRKKKIDFEIIQGITSAFAAPESFGIPLTKKGKFSSVAVLTGRKSNKESIDAPECDTLIYLMAAANIRNVVKAIINSGKDKNTPCAFIERGTTINERVIVGRLSDIVKKSEEQSLRPPAVFIVGDIVGFGKKIYADKYKKR
jgi:uroporphyrin-III C-methyltransferase